MFTVSAAEAAAIRTAFDQQGELSAAIEVRRLFPRITDNVKARVRSADRRVDASAIAGSPRDAAVSPSQFGFLRRLRFGILIGG